MAKTERHAELTLFDDHVLASLSDRKLENRGAVIFVSPNPFFVSRRRPDSHPPLRRGQRKKSRLSFSWILKCIPIEREASVLDMGCGLVEICEAFFFSF